MPHTDKAPIRRISILTIFPEAFTSFLASPVIKRAIDRGILQIEIVDIKAYAGGSFRHIDDSPYGGGPGMILKCDPVLRALQAAKEAGRAASAEDAHIVLFSPAGQAYTQKKAGSYLQVQHLILICGHYEGYDARIEEFVDEIISVGDYVLTGGELPAMIVTDSVVRLLPGVLRREATEDETFTNGLLEYPQYTHPADYEGMKVPEVLLSGNHEKIREWREQQSIERTRALRPDLWESYPHK